MVNINMNVLCLLAVLGLAFAHPDIYFREEFEAGWKSRWIESTHKGIEAGTFKWSAGKFYGDADKDKGIQTSQDAKFYALSAKLEKSFSNEGKNLIIQFTVKHEQNIDCGGGYVKVFAEGLDQMDMNGASPYLIMFGPDICGSGTKKVHVIFNYKGHNLPVKKDIRCMGEWKPKQIDNPAFKGKWIHPEIDNPEYEAGADLYKYDKIGAIGFDLWQGKSGTIFDNILITDGEKEAEYIGNETWGKTKDAEKKMKDQQDEEEQKNAEERAAERKTEQSPDICGPDTKKVNVIFNNKGHNLIKKYIICKAIEDGSLGDWDFLKPVKIKDLKAKQPEDRDAREKIDDPDPDSKKPDDWDDEMDGEWEPPINETQSTW